MTKTPNAISPISDVLLDPYVTGHANVISIRSVLISADISQFKNASPEILDSIMQNVQARITFQSKAYGTGLDE